MDSDNSKLSSCGGDRQLLYWDVSSGRIIRKFQGHDAEVWSLLATLHYHNNINNNNNRTNKNSNALYGTCCMNITK